MSEKEKIMTVTLMRSDLYDAPVYSAYAGADLKLPAGRDEIRDALDRARIKEGQPYQIVECFNIQGKELNYLPENPRLDELNFLAWRISELNEHDRIAFTGCAVMGEGNLGMNTLINQTYNLADVHVIPVDNDKDLGRFYVKNGFVEAVNHVPHEYREELLDYLDYAEIGCIWRETENGIFHNGSYIVNGSADWKTVYDGVHLPEMPQDPPYIFKLQLAEAPFDTSLDIENALATEHCVPLLLPATGQEILAALEQLGAASLAECVFYRCESPIPALEQAFSFSEDIERMNLLAGRLRELEQEGELPKFKAAFEIAGCEDVDQALDLTQNLDGYDFYPELSAAEGYGRMKFMKQYCVPEDDPAVQLIRFERYSPGMMHQDHAHVTSYGVIRHNGSEMTLKYSGPQLDRQEM